MGILDRALRLGEAKQYKGYAQRVDRINAFEPETELLTDEELRQEAEKLRERARDGETLDDLLYESFALTREASKRTLGGPSLGTRRGRGRRRLAGIQW